MRKIQLLFKSGGIATMEIDEDAGDSLQKTLKALREDMIRGSASGVCELINKRTDISLMYRPEQLEAVIALPKTC